MQFYPQDVIREEPVLEAVGVVQAEIDHSRRRGSPSCRPDRSRPPRRSPTSWPRSASRCCPLDQILGAITYLPLNVGEAWGYLRIFPPDNDELRPTDIPVFDELPLDLSVVAGVLTRAVQDTNSHVNLKSKERNTPNVVLRDAGPGSSAAGPVRRPAGAPGRRHATTSRSSRPPRRSSPRSSPSGWTARWSRWTWEPETELRSYDEMAAGTARPRRGRFAPRYGAKAANLGFLAHRDVLGRVGDRGQPERRARLRPGPGRASRCRCRRTATSSSIRRTPTSAHLIDALVADEQAGDAVAEGAGRSGSRRSRRRSWPARSRRARWSAIRAKIDETLPGVEKIKVRSSANAEDVPELRRRRPARQLRRRHRQAGPADRALPGRGGRRQRAARSSAR